MMMFDHDVNLQFSPKVTTKKLAQASKQTHLIISNQKYDFSMTDTVCGTVKTFCFALEFPATLTYGTNEIINGLKHVRLAPQSKFSKANEACGYNKSFHCV